MEPKPKPQHTPGPWEQKPCAFIEGAGGEAICQVDNWANGTKWNEANARLIAAAPELLEALRELVAIPSIGYGTVERECEAFRRVINNIARAAIAKATGQGEQSACGHESVTTPDGHGAYCKHCGETLA